MVMLENDEEEEVPENTEELLELRVSSKDCLLVHKFSYKHGKETKQLEWSESKEATQEKKQYQKCSQQTTYQQRLSNGLHREGLLELYTIELVSVAMKEEEEDTIELIIKSKIGWCIMNLKRERIINHLMCILFHRESEGSG